MPNRVLTIYLQRASPSSDFSRPLVSQVAHMSDRTGPDFALVDLLPPVSQSPVCRSLHACIPGPATPHQRQQQPAVVPRLCATAQVEESIASKPSPELTPNGTSCRLCGTSAKAQPPRFPFPHLLSSTVSSTASAGSIPLQLQQIRPLLATMRLSSKASQRAYFAGATQHVVSTL